MADWAQSGITQEEAVAFMSELGSAMSRCDSNWVEARMAPEISMTFIIQWPERTETRVPSRTEYVKFMRQSCQQLWMRPSFSKINYSITAGEYGATASGRWDKGSGGPPLSSVWNLKMDSAEETTTLTRGWDGTVYITGVYSVVVPQPK